MPIDLEAGSEESLYSSLNKVVRDKISHAAFVSSVDKIDSKSYLAHLGIIWSETFCDDKSGECTVKLLKNGNLGTLDVMRKEGRFFLENLSRPAVVSAVEKNLDVGFLQSENAMLQSTEQRLAKIPQVQTSMSVIYKIVRFVYENSSINLEQIPCRSSKRTAKTKRAKQYARLLTNLRILQDENSRFVPGPRMKDLSDAGLSSGEVFSGIMGEIYSRGYAYMRKELHLTGVVPYLRTTHSYYLPAYKSGKMLSLTGKSVAFNLATYYPLSRKYLEDYVTVNNWLYELDAAHIVEKQNEFVTGRADVWENYEALMRKASFVGFPVT